MPAKKSWGRLVKGYWPDRRGFTPEIGLWKLAGLQHGVLSSSRKGEEPLEQCPARHAVLREASHRDLFSVQEFGQRLPDARQHCLGSFPIALGQEDVEVLTVRPHTVDSSEKGAQDPHPFVLELGPISSAQDPGRRDRRARAGEANDRERVAVAPASVELLPKVLP